MLRVSDLIEKCNADVYFKVYDQRGNKHAEGDYKDLSKAYIKIDKNFHKSVCDYMVEDFWILDDYLNIHIFVE